jgi:hypothetical protein
VRERGIVEENLSDEKKKRKEKSNSPPRRKRRIAFLYPFLRREN